MEARWLLRWRSTLLAGLYHPPPHPDLRLYCLLAKRSSRGVAACDLKDIVSSQILQNYQLKTKDKEHLSTFQNPGFYETSCCIFANVTIRIWKGHSRTSEMLKKYLAWMDHRKQWMVLFMKIGFERIKMLSHSNFNILKTLIGSNQMLIKYLIL